MTDNQIAKARLEDAEKWAMRVDEDPAATDNERKLAHAILSLVANLQDEAAADERLKDHM